MQYRESERPEGRRIRSGWYTWMYEHTAYANKRTMAKLQATRLTRLQWTLVPSRDMALSVGARPGPSCQATLVAWTTGSISRPWR
ncbi:hypothetical protein BDQ94DRAFT_149617 [Aspergillus welwitschiae]|uniref:Uncharacterized protein n=1 Tax=Aspergillus welwitschiae TaxID=1341132 RepID=A0A3F3PSV1_9EURO|nr:hypothetical protein BDQ94DRAFT_149617 [Aspergillus welwitschiae]RDH29852.1 hypothetical protein BDQ94DRAFT_149617 [Aspergillus welwitschiae]